MNNDIIEIPHITNIGLFDIRLKYGSVPVTKIRRVRSYEIEMPAEDGGISYIDNKAYPIEYGNIICAKPGQMRRTKPPFSCYYIHLIPDNGTLCRQFAMLPDVIKANNIKQYELLFKNILSHYNENAHTVSLALSGMLLILTDMMKKDAEASKTTDLKGHERANTKAIKDAVEYIDNNLTQDLSLKTLSKRVFLSPIYFRNLFYDTVGMSPYEYILDKRIQTSKKLLATTDMSISEISEYCGFSSQAYFGQVFKRFTSVTPKKFRININNLYP